MLAKRTHATTFGELTNLRNVGDTTYVFSCYSESNASAANFWFSPRSFQNVTQLKTSANLIEKRTPAATTGDITKLINSQEHFCCLRHNACSSRLTCEAFFAEEEAPAPGFGDLTRQLLSKRSGIYILYIYTCVHIYIYVQMYIYIYIYMYMPFNINC